MADIKKKLNEVKKVVSNQDEATKVMAIIMEIVEEFEDKLSLIDKRQSMLEEQNGEIVEMLENIEEELVTALNEDFEAECPYCGETIPFKIPEEGEEFECPKCHNTIELEAMFGADCDCDCEDCDHEDCDCDDCDCDDCDCDSDEDEEE